MKKVLLVLGIGLLLSIVVTTLVAVRAGDRTPPSVEALPTCEFPFAEIVKRSSPVSESFGSDLTQKRSNFGSTQVRDISGITPGKVYLQHDKHSTQIITPLEAPYLEKNGSWWFKGLWYTSMGQIHEVKVSLADSGVTPYYPTGLWNTTNWIEPAEDIHPDDLPCLPF